MANKEFIAKNGLSVEGTATLQDLIPDGDSTRNAGNGSFQWQNMYIGSGALFVGGQSALTDSANTIVLRADINNDVQITTSGTGDVELLASGTGALNLNSNIVLLATKTITTSDSSAIEIGDEIDMNSNKITGLGTPTADTDAATKISSESYADGTGDVFKVGTPGVNQLGVWTGDGTIEGDINLTFSVGTMVIGSDTNGIIESGAGRALTLYAGAGGAAATLRGATNAGGLGGAAYLEGGSGTTGGGLVTIEGGDASAGTTGGNITLRPGKGTVNPGAVLIAPQLFAPKTEITLRFLEDADNGAGWIGLKAPASIVTDRTWTLPQNAPVAGQFLQTDGSGILSFAAESNDLSVAVTWANVPDGNITESSVTQHTAAVVTTGAVTTAGAVMDSEVDADIKTLVLPASTTISTFGASLVDDADQSAAQTTLGVDPIGTDNSTDVTLAGTGTYISIAGQIITVDPISESDITDLQSYELLSNKNAANGYAGLVGGLIDSAQLPPVSITSTFVVASEIAQLALTVQEGDVAVRTDENKSYIALNADNVDMGDWQELLTPTDAVTSVAGKTGVVVLATGDIASGTFLDARIAETNVTQHEAALSITESQISNLFTTIAPLANPTFTGSFTSPGIDDNASAERLQIGDGSFVVGANDVASFGMQRASNTGIFTMSGGNATFAGADLVLYSGAHSSNAGDFFLRSVTDTIVNWDKSAGTLVFDAGTTPTANLTLSGNAGSELATFTGDVNLTSSGQLQLNSRYVIALVEFQLAAVTQDNWVNLGELQNGNYTIRIATNGSSLYNSAAYEINGAWAGAADGDGTHNAFHASTLRHDVGFVELEGIFFEFVSTDSANVWLQLQGTVAGVGNYKVSVEGMSYNTPAFVEDGTITQTDPTLTASVPRITTVDTTTVSIAGDLIGLTKDAGNNATNMATTAYVSNNHAYVNDTGISSGVWLAAVPGVTAYYHGLRVTVRLGIVGISGGSTLNINSLGAKKCYTDFNSVMTTHYTTGDNVDFVYDSTLDTAAGGFQLAQDFYFSNESYTTRWHNTTAKAGEQIYGYELLLQDAADGKFYSVTTPSTSASSTTSVVSTREFALDGIVLQYYTSTDVAADATMSSIYTGILSTLMNYWDNHGSVAWMTHNEPLYLKGNVTNGNFVLDNTSFTSWLTQTLPVSADGYVYMLLGWAYGLNDYRLSTVHPIYHYTNGQVRLYAEPNFQTDITSTGDIIVGASASNVVDAGKFQYDPANHGAAQTGSLELKNLGSGNDVALNVNVGGNARALVIADGGTGAAILRHTASDKLTTTATGVDITGTLSATVEVDAPLVTTTTGYGTGFHLESGNHQWNANDGGGNVNMRVANDFTTGCTEAGFAWHEVWTQSNGNYLFKVSSATLAVLDTPTWLTQITVDPTAVSLGYAGAVKIATSTVGVTVTGVMTGTATIAQYADLAEIYSSDRDYEPGTVVMFGGEKEVTVATSCTTAIAGIVSTDPGFLMNGDAKGIAVALRGRVPCKVYGKISKGDLMVAGKHGRAMSHPLSNPNANAVLGRALENHEGGEGVIEVVVS